MAYKSKLQIQDSKQVMVLTDESNKSTFTYNTIQYPIGSLGSEQYPHYAVFYINENSKAVRVDAFTSAETEAITKDNSANQSFSKSIVSGGRNVANAGSNTVSAIGNNVPGASYLTDPLNTAGKFVGGKLSEWKESRKRLKLALCLPMPQKIRANYNASYAATEEVGALGAVIASAINGNMSDAAQTALIGLSPTVVGVATETTKSLASKVIGANAAEGVVGKGLSTNAVSQIVSKISGRVINKRQEQLFNNMEFRTHNFSYLFVPRNQAESDAIKQIINAFKLYMHPELNEGQGSSLLITPAEFDIEFRFMSDENKSVHRIATCALKAMDVNYTALGEFIAFKDTDNPVAISLDLTFVEMEPITRKQIRLGF